MVVEVYPKTVVYCPKTKQERDGNDCNVCEHYKDRKLNGGQTYIECKYK